jgi:hypothetical protein
MKENQSENNQVNQIELCKPVILNSIIYASENNYI